MTTRPATVFDPANHRHRAALRRQLVLETHGGAVAPKATLRQLAMLQLLDTLDPPRRRRRRKDTP